MVAKQCIAPAKPSLKSFGVGVDKQLVRIESMPIHRIEWSIDSVPVKQIGSSVRQIGVPDFVGVFGKDDAGLLMPAGAVEEAELDFFGVRRKDRKVDAFTVPSRSERVRAARPH